MRKIKEVRTKDKQAESCDSVSATGKIIFKKFEPDRGETETDGADVGLGEDGPDGRDLHDLLRRPAE